MSIAVDSIKLKCPECRLDAVAITVVNDEHFEVKTVVFCPFCGQNFKKKKFNIG